MYSETALAHNTELGGFDFGESVAAGFGCRGAVYVKLSLLDILGFNVVLSNNAASLELKMGIAQLSRVHLQ